MSRRRKTPSPHTGMLLLDKPAAMTSHDVVGWVRRRLGMRRVGHTGTLDPLATGLLPCLLGPATRLARFLHLWPKVYVGRIVLGAESPTGDREGVVGSAPSRGVPVPPPVVLAAARTQLMNATTQMPPAFSAKKIGGVPAHKIARRGLEPRLAPVPVTIHALRLVAEPEGRIRFATRVSSGTYIRSIARDLGRILGTGAYLDTLRRTAIGPLRVRQAPVAGSPVEPSHLAAAIMKPEQIPLPLDTRTVDREDELALRLGRAISVEEAMHCGRTVRLLAASGELIGIGEIGESGLLQPRMVLPSETSADETGMIARPD